MAAKNIIKSLYYITHVSNLPSILQHGILSHRLVEERGVKFTPIYDGQIVDRRRERQTPDGKSLWHFANVYFQPRNPMLYRVIHEADQKNLAIVSVQPNVLDQPGTYIATGNAASSPTDILPTRQGRSEIRKMSSILTNDWWKEEDGSKRKIMAEGLIPDIIEPKYIHSIYVANRQIADSIKENLKISAVPIVPEPHMFFQPRFSSKIASKLFLIDGDMFFSKMQTLTISVNTVGVMGKGLASRTKYQFPDVYVEYQDVCRRKALQMGKPYLYKRESSLDDELADEPSKLTNPNANKWFLLFPTKKHWREKSPISGIQQGIDWLYNNYKNLGIQSLAVPALGCGLGGLEWQDVGPLMCKSFVEFEIPVAIYLPREQQLSKEYLSRKFLLSD